MEYRALGASGLRASARDFGAGTFGGSGPLFPVWGDTGEADARRLVDIALAAGVNFSNTADVYSDGASKTVLGAVLSGRRRPAGRAAACAELAAAAPGRVHRAGRRAQCRAAGAEPRPAGWALMPAQVERLDVASATTPPYPYYPYWNGMFAELSAPPVAPHRPSSL